MTRSELVARLVDLNPHLRIRDAEAVVDTILGCIKEALIAGGRVELRNFGTFTARHREARQGRNPKTGATVDVPAKTDVRFKPGKTMKAQLNLEPAALAEAAE